MKVLIVHAHHEPKSFCSALFRKAVQTLSDVGHEVVVSDLYSERFDPVSDRRNFSSVLDAGYLKQQAEEKHASEVWGFTPGLETEIRKLESCDLLIFTFPLWWFSLPAILKGWVDRAFPMGRVYGDGKIYENGLGKARKRALIIMTVGGREESYSEYGVNPPLASVLAPIQHGIFWFNGFLPLDPFLVWGPARISAEERKTYLRQLDERLRKLDKETPLTLPPFGDFSEFKDQQKRFMASITYRIKPAGNHRASLSALLQSISELKRSGIVLHSYLGSLQDDPWRGYLVFRESGANQVLQHLNKLPLASHFNFEVNELDSALIESTVREATV
jgi:NAD(P)H dehydrogenase (quinone)